MKKINSIETLVFLVFLFISNSVYLQALPVYRFYNPYSQRHFYTTDIKGEDFGEEYYREGIAFYALENGMPVYRYYDVSRNLHLWTTKPENEDLTSYEKEDIAFRVPTSNGINLFRYVNKQSGRHFWTIRPKDENLNGFSKEGIAFQSAKFRKEKPRISHKPGNTSCEIKCGDTFCVFKDDIDSFVAGKDNVSVRVIASATQNIKLTKIRFKNQGNGNNYELKGTQVIRTGGKSIRVKKGTYKIEVDYVGTCDGVRPYNLKVKVRW